MASKSKKRRRVLGASCILAALIVAGSSFAWFTSKDEVTNRLTASSDYGVSIVESFTPPKNWIPGQEINKDVYAVNTGNIEAFVKEELSGILDYSYEYKVPTWDSQCVTLDQNNVTAIDGATMNEAGAFLAWTNAEDVPYGVVVSSAREADADNPETVTPRWTPTKNGDYIFRRSIGTKHVDANGDDPNAEGYVAAHDETVYTYAGYHYEDGQYYKIVIGNDDFRAANDSDTPATIETDGSNTRRYVFDISVDSDSLGVDVDENGVLQSAPTINYVKVADLDPTAISFIYDDTTSQGTEGDKYDGAPYLKVRYDNTNGDMAAKTEAVEAAQAVLNQKEAALLAAQAAAGPKSKAVADAEADYYNALYEYYTAYSRAQKTAADFTYADELQKATNKLYPKAKDRYEAETTKTTYKSELDEAKAALDAEIDKESTDNGTETTFDDFADISSAMTNATTGIASTILVSEAVRNQVADNDDNTNTLTEIKRNIAALDAIWDQIAGENGILSTISADYEALQALDGTMPDAKAENDPKAPDKYEALSNQLQGHIDTLQSLLANYKNTYNTFTVNVDEAHLTGLNLVTEDVSAIEAYSKEDSSGSVDKLETRVKDTTNGLDGKIAAYKSKYEQYYDYVDPTAPAGYASVVDAWTEAVNTYNEEVSAAKTKYDGANGVGEVQNLRNNASTDYTITNDGPDGKWTLVNDGETLVNGYSAHKIAAVGAVTDNDGKKATSDADPQISGDETNYLNFVGENGAQITAPTDLVRNNFEQLNADNSEGTDTKQTLQALETAKTQKKTASDNKEGTYNTAKTNAQAELTALQTAETQYATAKAAYDAAVAAQNQASGGSSIKIDVVLDKDVVKNGTDTDKATWVFDTATDNLPTPTFYYNRIVGAGETTNKLVDKLVFCDDVKASDYKELQFDLNVKLDSAQVVYDDATQSTILTTAVDANDAFALDAAVEDNSKVTWTAPTTP